MEVFQFEKLLQYDEGLLETQEKRMCASFPEGNAAKWVNTCQMSRQKGSQRECSLKWRCRAKNMGFLLIFFICTTETTFSNPTWTYTKRGENVYREEFLEDVSPKK